jgi:phosphoribosylanthranilate isomerase
MQVKICGITNMEDAMCAAENGAAAVGCIFHPPSPRYIDRKKQQKSLTVCLNIW